VVVIITLLPIEIGRVDIMGVLMAVTMCLLPHQLPLLPQILLQLRMSNIAIRMKSGGEVLMEVNSAVPITPQ
jgi:hypothetical protein